jgi:hypothetical protein
MYSGLGWLPYASCFRIEYRKWCCQIACLAASAAAMYSASDEDVAVFGCLRFKQLTGPPAKMKTYSLVERKRAAFPYAAFVYPMSLSQLLPFT